MGSWSGLLKKFLHLFDLLRVKWVEHAQRSIRQDRLDSNNFSGRGVGDDGEGRCSSVGTNGLLHETVSPSRPMPTTMPST